MFATVLWEQTTSRDGVVVIIADVVQLDPTIVVNTITIITHVVVGPLRSLAQKSRWGWDIRGLWMFYN